RPDARAVLGRVRDDVGVVPGPAAGDDVRSADRRVHRPLRLAALRKLPARGDAGRHPGRGQAHRPRRKPRDPAEDARRAPVRAAHVALGRLPALVQAPLRRPALPPGGAGVGGPPRLPALRSHGDVLGLPTLGKNIPVDLRYSSYSGNASASFLSSFRARIVWPATNTM